MADTLRQESKGGVNKVLLGIAIVIVALNVLLFCVVPTQKTVSFTGQVSAYSVEDESYEALHTVEISGTLMTSVFLDSTFEGTFYISGIPGLTREMTLSLTREDGAWRGGFLDAEGKSAELYGVQVAATKDFEKITVSFLQNGEEYFLALDCPNRTYALRQYQELIAKSTP